MSIPRTLHTDDGLALQAELGAAAGRPRAGIVLCHPHPQYGGTMRSIVTSALFDALPRRGCTCVRFNFRGVEDSEGTYGEGRDEARDVVAAISAVSGEVVDVPLVLVGWSFGGDVALSVPDPRLSGWVGIAPPLRFGSAHDVVALDPRPKLLVLAAHDEFRAAREVEVVTKSWTNTTLEVVPGASHFFVGRTEPVIAAVAAFVDVLETRARA